MTVFSKYPSFDPKAPTTPASLKAVGLVSDCPYIIDDKEEDSTGEGFAGVVSSIISKKLFLKSDSEKELTEQLICAFSSNRVLNENDLSVMDDPKHWATSLPDSELSRLNHTALRLTGPAVACLCKIATVLSGAREHNTFLSKGATYESLSLWIDSLSDLRRNDAASSHYRTSPGAAGVTVATPSTVSSQRVKSDDKLPRFEIKKFTEDILQGDLFIRKVHNQFESNAVSDYLTDPAVCAANHSWSKAFASRLRSSILEHAELGYIATTNENEFNCATLWSKIKDSIEKKDALLSRECHLWQQLFALKCDDLDDFGKYFSEVKKVIHRLTNMNSSAIQDDNFLRVQLHRAIDVKELKVPCNKFLEDFTKQAEELLDRVKKAYSNAKTSSSIKGNTSGSSTTIPKKVREAKATKVTETTKETAKFTPFPKNFGSRIPQEYYNQFRKWYNVAAKPDRSDKDIKFLKGFTFRDRLTDEKERTYNEDRERREKGKYTKQDAYHERKSRRMAREADDYDDRHYYRSRSRSYDRDYDRARRSPPRESTRETQRRPVDRGAREAPLRNRRMVMFGGRDYGGRGITRRPPSPPPRR